MLLQYSKTQSISKIENPKMDTYIFIDVCKVMQGDGNSWPVLGTSAVLQSTFRPKLRLLLSSAIKKCTLRSLIDFLLCSKNQFTGYFEITRRLERFT